jgi:ferritin-like metal-binding protein YciE
MAKSTTLHDAFVGELRDAYDCEHQLLKVLPKLAKAASSPELRDAFESHLEETRGHVERLEQVFSHLGEKPKGKHCDGIAGIIQEGGSVMKEDFDDTTMDACLIAGGQRAEHYEIAAYGALIAWARAMGHEEAAGLLHETLEEEKAADEKLSQLAEGGINEAAAKLAHPNGEAAGDMDESMSGRGNGRARARTTSASVSKRRSSSRGSRTSD